MKQAGRKRPGRNWQKSGGYNKRSKGNYQRNSEDGTAKVYYHASWLVDPWEEHRQGPPAYYDPSWLADPWAHFMDSQTTPDVQPDNKVETVN